MRFTIFLQLFTTIKTRQTRQFITILSNNFAGPPYTKINFSKRLRTLGFIYNYLQPQKLVELDYL